MKKAILTMVIAAGLYACGGGESTETTTQPISNATTEETAPVAEAVTEEAPAAEVTEAPSADATTEAAAE